jgi:hypothetical protein
MGPLKTIAVLSILLAPVATATSYAGALDVPVQPRTPTVRSELKRGLDSVRACDDWYYSCALKLTNSNAQTGTDTAPFLTGVWYMTALNLSLRGKDLGDSYARYLQAVQEAHLTLRDVCNVAFDEPNKCYSPVPVR